MLAELKVGKITRRTSWSPRYKDMGLAVFDKTIKTVRTQDPNKPVALFHADGTYEWKTDDLFGNDWQIVEPVETLTFETAIQHVQEGKRVRRKCWEGTHCLQKTKFDSLILVDYRNDNTAAYIDYDITDDAVNATDWLLIGDLVEVQYPITGFNVTDECEQALDSAMDVLVPRTHDLDYNAAMQLVTEGYYASRVSWEKGLFVKKTVGSHHKVKIDEFSCVLSDYTYYATLEDATSNDWFVKDRAFSHPQENIEVSGSDNLTCSVAMRLVNGGYYARRPHWDKYVYVKKMNDARYKVTLDASLVFHGKACVMESFHYTPTEKDKAAQDWHVKTFEPSTKPKNNVSSLADEFKTAAAYIDDIIITRLLDDVGNELEKINKDDIVMAISKMCRLSKTADDWLCEETHNNETLYSTCIQIAAYAFASAAKNL